MDRVLRCDGTKDADVVRVGLLWEGFTGGAATEGMALAKEGKYQSRQDRKSETRIRASLFEITDPIGDESEIKKTKSGVPIDGRPRKLKSDGGDLKLDAEDFERLARYVEQTGWAPEVRALVSDLEDWLQSADRV